MQINGIKLLDKFSKNSTTLKQAVSAFLSKVKTAAWKNDDDLKASFPDADRIFGGVYVFNLTNSDRTLTIVYFKAGEVDIVWVGDHQDYDRELKNNKDSIKRVLKKKGYDV